MPNYAFKAVTEQNEVVDGTVEADNNHEAYFLISQQGLTPTELTELTEDEGEAEAE